MKKLMILTTIALSANIVNAQWQQTNGPYGVTINSIATDGTNIFAGTNGGGVFLSTNNGSSWTAVNNGLTSLYISSVVISGTNIFVGTPNFAGVFLSTDNGSNWAAVNNGLTNLSVRTLAIGGSNIYAGTQGGVFLSTNNGSSWTAAANNGLSGFALKLAISGINIFAGNQFGVFLSTDNGNNWATVNTGLTSTAVGALAINGSNIYAGTSGVFLSTDNGSSWAAAGLAGYSVISLATSGTNIFAGTSAGVFLSIDNGSNWTAVNNGLPVDKSAASLAISGSNIFAGYSLLGVFLSTNNGSSWAAVNNGLTYNNAATDVNSLVISGTNFFTGTNAGVFLSTDNGSTWTAVNNGLNIYFGIYSLAISGTNIFAGGYQGVFLSTNNGSNWTAVNNGLASNTVMSLAISGSNIFAGTTQGGVFLSTDNGSNWAAVNNDLTNLSVRTLAIGGSNIYAGTQGGVFLSTNNGSSWTAMNNGLTNLSVSSLAINGSNIYAGTNGVVFLSTNNGSSWSATGLINAYSPYGNSIRVGALAINSNNIFAGMSNSEVFLSTDNGSTWTAVSNGIPISGFSQFTGNPITEITSLAISGSHIFAGRNIGSGSYNAGLWKRALSEMTNTQIIYPKLTLNSSNINAGQSISITGSDFSTNGKVQLNISGAGGFSQNNTLTATGTGFTYSFATDTSMAAGIYYVQATDSISGNSTAIKSFQLINNTTPPTGYLQIIYPTQNLTFYTSDSINIEWQDKMVLGSSYTVSGSKRNYKYTIEYSVNGGPYQNIATVQGQAYINSTVNLNRKFKLGFASINVVVRVTDFYDVTNFKISYPFDVAAPPAGNALVNLKWDYSFPDPGVPCLGVAADGVSRIYLQLTSTGGTISNVSVTLSDGVNTVPAKLGKVMVAADTASYSSEANGITATTATDNASKTNYYFWYVSPDDFAGNNPADTSSSYRIVNAVFTVNYSSGGSETKTQPVKIVRPPLMLVHGLGGDPGSFDNFQSTNFGKLVNDTRFLIKRAIKMSPTANFLTNAYDICPPNMTPGNANFYNTFQGIIYDLRKQGYASNQVDYIGHSMGGSVLRSLLDNYYSVFTRTGSYANKEYKNYESGYAHKVITIGTPHNSSPWADVVNRYVGDLPLTARFTIMNWYGTLFPWSLPSNFIKPVNPNAFIWDYTVTDAVSNLQINQASGGINFNTANIKAHLIAGDFFPGTQASLPSLIPQTAINYVQNVGNEILEQFLNYLLKVAAVKESNPQLKSEFANILANKIDPISDALNFLDKAAKAMDVVNMVTFLPESDLIVHLTSQLADNPINAPNVTVFDNWVGHTIIRAELSNTDIGNRVNVLLNSPVDSALFAGISATSNKKGNNPLSPLASTSIIDKIDTTMLNLLSPGNGTVISADTTINVLIDVKDTAKLSALTLRFQNKEYPVNNFQFGLNNLSIQVNNQMLDTQLISLEGFYLYSDSGVFVRDDVKFVVTTSSPLINFQVNPDILYLVTGEVTQVQHIGVYQDFVAAVSNFHPNISVSVNNPSVVQFDSGSKLFKGIAEGETYAVVTFQSFSDTVYFVVFEMYIDSTLIGIDEPEISVTNGNEKSILVFPNPFSTSTTALIKETDKQANENWNLTIYDVLGKEVKRMQSLTPEFTINRDGLQVGMYFYNVTGKTGIVGSGKLIVVD